MKGMVGNREDRMEEGEISLITYYSVGLQMNMIKNMVGYLCQARCAFIDLLPVCHLVHHKENSMVYKPSPKGYNFNILKSINLV